MLERLKSVGYQPHVGKFRKEQQARRATMSRVPNERPAYTHMHTIRVVPKNGSTETTVNPLDPDGDGYVYDDDPSMGPVARTGIWRGF